MPDEPRGPRSGACVQHMNLRVVPRSGIGEFRNGEAVDDIEQRDLPFSHREERNIQQRNQQCHTAELEVLPRTDSRRRPQTTPWQCPKTDRENFLSDSVPRCCKLQHSDARVPTANQRSRSGADRVVALEGTRLTIALS